MFQKIIASIALKIAEALSSAIIATIQSAMATAVEAFQSRQIEKLKTELYDLRVELISKERLTNNEAMDFANRINNIRSKL